MSIKLVGDHRANRASCTSLSRKTTSDVQENGGQKLKARKVQRSNVKPTAVDDQENSCPHDQQQHMVDRNREMSTFGPDNTW